MMCLPCASLKSFYLIPQTVLALMEFSRALPSSLDLLNFEVRECREKLSRIPPPAWESRKLEIQEFKNLEAKKALKIEIIRMKIRSAQNVGKVLVSMEKCLLASFGAISTIVFTCR